MKTTKPRFPGLPAFTKKHALACVGGSIGKTKKMPGASFGLSAKACKTGGKLRGKDGTICRTCYAMGGNYMYPSVQTAHERRLAQLDNPEWCEAMAWLILEDGRPFFRWHDSGDVQSLEHFERIVYVAALTPGVMHWLPTKEYSVYREFQRKHGDVRELVPNLVVRLSAPFVDHAAPASWNGTPHALSHTTPKPPAGSVACYAMEPGKDGKTAGNCGDCRVCWKRDLIPSYRVHR